MIVNSKFAGLLSINIICGVLLVYGTGQTNLEIFFKDLRANKNKNASKFILCQPPAVERLID